MVGFFNCLFWPIGMMAEHLTTFSEVAALTGHGHTPKGSERGIKGDIFSQHYRRRGRPHYERATLKVNECADVRKQIIRRLNIA